MTIGDKRFVFAAVWGEPFAINEQTVIAISPTGRPAFRMTSRGWGAKKRITPYYTDETGYATFDEAKAAEVARVQREVDSLQERLDQKLELLRRINEIPAPEAVAV